MKKIIFFIFVFVAVYANSNEHYEVYHYVDNHHVKTIINHKFSYQSPIIDAKLHVRNMENNNTLYTIFWLENGVTDKVLIDINSIYAPFLVIRSKVREEFQIEKLKTLSKDNLVHQRLFGIIDLLQFKFKDGLYKFKNTMGTIDVNQINTNGIYLIKRLTQYKKNDQKYDIKYFYSDTNISIDKNSLMWDNVSTQEKVKIYVDFMKTTAVDKRVFTMSKSDETLEKDHWFFSLPVDITSWKFNERRNPLSLKNALENFDKYHKEMLVVLDDNKKFQKWVEEHMDFLQYLSVMLESKNLNNEVSKALFAKLGYIDSAESTQILANVLLNIRLSKTERFRSLMGFKNTSAPLDDDILSDIVEYGLFTRHGNDMIQNATGMLIGALAKERIKRVPKQYEQLSEAIIDAIKTSDNMVVALNAAGNMLETASDEIIETVDDVLKNDSNTLNRMKSAEVLLRIGKTSLDTASFQELMDKEDNSDTIAQLIRSSAIAKDFKSNDKYKEWLIDIADNRAGMQSGRLAALETLEKSNFAKDPSNKKKLRKMMINEKDIEISKMLKKLYRAQ